jgi:hypothetical protein
MKKTIALLFVCVSLVFSQTATVSLGSVLADVDQLSINDFNVLGQGNIKSIFSGSIALSGFSASTSDNNVKIKVTFTKDGKTVFSGQTNTILNPSDQTVNFNSRNLGEAFRVNLKTDGTEDFDFNIKVESDADLKSDQAIPTILPNGRYVLTFTTVVNDADDSSDNITLTLNNQWQITLSSPYNWETLSTRPFFQWFSPSPFKKYKLSVWEVMNAGASDDEIRNSIPVLETEESGNSSQFTYPPSASSLIVGKTYAWTVTGIIRKLSGEVEIPTTLNKFVFSNSEGSASASVIDDLLRQLLMKNYDIVKKDLTGFSATGIIKLNGKEIKASGVGTFIDAVQTGKKRIEVEVN